MNRIIAEQDAPNYWAAYIEDEPCKAFGGDSPAVAVAIHADHLPRNFSFEKFHPIKKARNTSSHGADADGPTNSNSGRQSSFLFSSLSQFQNHYWYQKRSSKRGKQSIPLTQSNDIRNLIKQ